MFQRSLLIHLQNLFHFKFNVFISLFHSKNKYRIYRVLLSDSALKNYFLCQFLILKKLSKRTSQMEILFSVLANPSSWCRQCITLFRNGSTGYLLISDYTIKINFLHEISIQKKLSKCSTQLETLHWQTHFSPSKHIYI